MYQMKSHPAERMAMLASLVLTAVLLVVCWNIRSNIATILLIVFLLLDLLLMYLLLRVPSVTFLDNRMQIERKGFRMQEIYYCDIREIENAANGKNSVVLCYNQGDRRRRKTLVPRDLQGFLSELRTHVKEN